MGINRSEIEDFLYREMELLDHWDLEKWVGLFEQGGQYLVPSTDLTQESEPGKHLYLIADDYERLKGRAARLLKKTAHVEFPHSKTIHIVSNVRIKKITADGNLVEAVCNFVVYRSKRELDIFPGESTYTLCKRENEYKIVKKVSTLALDTLRPHGKVSIIL